MCRYPKIPFLFVFKLSCEAPKGFFLTFNLKINLDFQKNRKDRIDSIYVSPVSFHVNNLNNHDTFIKVKNLSLVQHYQL